MADTPQNSKSPDEKQLYDAMGLNKKLLNNLNSAQNSFDKTKIEGLKKQISSYKELRKETEAAWNAGKVGADQYLNAISKISEKEKELTKLSLKASGSWGKVRDEFTRETGKAFDALSNKLGIDVQNAGLVAWGIWALKVADAQRVMTNFAQYSGEIFGNLGWSDPQTGKKAGEEFWHAFYSPIADADSMRFVSMDMRRAFTEQSFRLGTPYRSPSGKDKNGGLLPELNGAEVRKATDNMLVLGQAYGMTSEQMAGSLFHFTDVLNGQTIQATKSIENLIGVSVKLGVAPAKFLGMVEQLTKAFKIQRIGVTEVTTIYNKYLDLSKGIGREMSAELTAQTVSSLAGMGHSQIAGMLSKTSGHTGNDLTNDLMAFYRTKPGDDSKSRLALTQSYLSKFPEVMKDQFRGINLVMSTLGIQDMAMGTRVFDALTNKKGKPGSDDDGIGKALRLLKGTTSYSDQMLTMMVNGLQAIVQLLVSIATSTAISGEVSPATRELMNSFDKMAENNRLQDKFNKTYSELDDLDAATSKGKNGPLAHRYWDKKKELDELAKSITEANSKKASADQDNYRKKRDLTTPSGVNGLVTDLTLNVTGQPWLLSMFHFVAKKEQEGLTYNVPADDTPLGQSIPIH